MSHSMDEIFLTLNPSQSEVKMPTGKDIRAKNERVSIKYMLSINIAPSTQSSSIAKQDDPTYFVQSLPLILPTSTRFSLGHYSSQRLQGMERNL